MNIKDIRGEQALDVMAEIVGFAGEIVQDEEIKRLAKGDELKAVQLLVKRHKDATLHILAALNSVDCDDEEAYREYVDSLTIMDIINEVREIGKIPELRGLFT